mmetsp:Transcript_66984/g.143244  ORF Transcript_66984/g.143244 Transcript_66984/m.143244 type:complete len:80 (+) Transcript_66984:80-319(+)
MVCLISAGLYAESSTLPITEYSYRGATCELSGTEKASSTANDKLELEIQALLIAGLARHIMCNAKINEQTLLRFQNLRC